MAKLKPHLNGPSLTVTTTSAIVAGTTSGYETYEVFGPVQVITDTVFSSSCSMATYGGDAPPTSVTYPAGFVVYKYFKTLTIISGSVEMMGHTDIEDVGLQ